jgi:hypothetical protein
LLVLVIAPLVFRTLSWPRIRLALSWAKDEGLDGFIVASDCLYVLQRMKDDKSDRSSCGLIIHDIKKLSVIFSSCYFRHVGREQNFVAHNLARSCEFASMSVWHGMPLEYIRVAICNDSISGLINKAHTFSQKKTNLRSMTMIKSTY